MGTSRTLVLSRPDQLRAATSVVAHQILSVMERERLCTVAELSSHTGIPAGSLYYHVRKLRDAGVLEEREQRSTRGRPEAVYELKGREIVFDPEETSPSFIEALGRTVRSRLRMLERAYLGALGHRRGVRRGRGRNLSLHQHHARLGPRDRAELYRRIEELEAFLVERDDPEREDFTHVTIAVLPVVRD